MSFLLKSIGPAKDAVAVSIAADQLIQELWESRVWINPRVFLKSAQATLACLALQGLNEEDSRQSVELQWTWDNAAFKGLSADSLFQGTVRTNYTWIGEPSEELPALNGRFRLRRMEDLYETSGIVESSGDVVQDVQDILLKSEQKDCAIGISVRWNIEEGGDVPRLVITRAHAYLLHILPPPMESMRDDLLERWQFFLQSLRSPAEWELSKDPEVAAQEMNAFLLASPHTQTLFSKELLFFCTCNQQKVENILKLLPAEDLASLEAMVEISCKYCGKTYLVDKSKSGLA